MAVALAGPCLAADPPPHQWGRLTVAGEATASLAQPDPAFFDDTGYRGNPLRTVSLTLTGSLRLARSAELIFEARTENREWPRFYAFYLRLRPWRERLFDVQIGLIPPVFGAFSRRSYGSGNPLIGRPLAYQYLTTVRTDAVPASVDNLLSVRGHGWRVFYPVGNPYPEPGLPLVQSERFDVGAEVRVGTGPWQLSAAVTQGSLSDPKVNDDNGGKQVSARLQAAPVIGLVLGLSAARGQYTERALATALPSPYAPGAGQQRALGFDAEYSRGHATLRAEGVFCAWDLPTIRSPPIDGPVVARAMSFEGIYRLAPGLDAAARFDTLRFSEVSGSSVREPWDLPVTRLEAGLAYALRRGLFLKVAYQRNWRDGGPPGRDAFPAVQVLWRF